MKNIKTFNQFITEDNNNDLYNIQNNTDNISKIKKAPDFYKEANRKPEPSADDTIEPLDIFLPLDNGDVENDKRLEIAKFNNNTNNPKNIEDFINN